MAEQNENVIRIEEYMERNRGTELSHFASVTNLQSTGFEKQFVSPEAISTSARSGSRAAPIEEVYPKIASGLYREFIAALKERPERIQKETLGTIKIGILPTKNLEVPIDAIIEHDGEGYIARTLDIPLYGFGDDPVEAVNTLKCEIESLYDDLMEDNNFTEEWLKIKEYLKVRIIN